jgi:hypothetical protein
MMLKWLEESGQTVPAAFPGRKDPAKQQIIVRGKVLDFSDAVVERDRELPAGEKKAVDKDKRVVKKKDALKKDLLSGAVVVDMIGDGPSGEMLLLDKDGNLVAHNAGEDSATYKQWYDAEDDTAYKKWYDAEVAKAAPVRRGHTPLINPPPVPPGEHHRDLFGDSGNQPTHSPPKTNN